LSHGANAVVSIFTRNEPDARHEYLSVTPVIPLVNLLNKNGFRYLNSNSVVSNFAAHTFIRGGLKVVLHYFAANGRVGWELRDPADQEVAACGGTVGQLSGALSSWLGGV
jgi:hypothetical protein